MVIEKKLLATMEIIKSKILKPEQKEDIVNLWNREYPKDLSLAGVPAFDEYLEKLSDKHYLRNVTGSQGSG